MTYLTVDIAPIPEGQGRLRLRCGLKTRENARLRLEISSTPELDRGACAGIEKLAVAGRKISVGEELVPDAGVLEYAYEAVVPRLDPQRSNLLTGFAWEGTAWATLSAVILLPAPRPPRLTVKLRPGAGIVLPGEEGASTSGISQDLSERDLRRSLALWGGFDVEGPFHVPGGRLFVPPDLRDDIAALRSVLVRLFSFEAFGSVTYALFPLLPPVGKGGFAGAGLAGRGCVCLFTPENFREMDRHGLLWLASHELAHLWLGVSVRAGETGLDWFVEGMAAYFALLAMRRCRAADEPFLAGMLAVSLQRLAHAGKDRRAGGGESANRAMHEGLLLAVLVGAELHAAGRTTLESAVGRLVRDRREKGEDLTMTAIREALESTGSTFAMQALERLSRGDAILSPETVDRLHSLARDMPSSGIPREIRGLIKPLSG
jgi:hypothetical protein